MEDDPEKDNYELAIIDGDRSTEAAVRHNLDLVNQSKADWILLPNILDPHVENAVDAFLTTNDEDWVWHRTVQWKTTPAGRHDNNVFTNTAFLLNRLRSLDD